ncbi:MAG: alpha/beta hydrolase [Burkholderiales bacterium]|nr:alpha/beta hydrolase [Burkholderiales bacterium]
MPSNANSGTTNALIPGGSRSLDALKHEVQRRADRGMPPLGGISPGDTRAALAQIDSLSREQWALAWSSIADQHIAQAQSSPAAAREHYWHAWRLFHFARWPVENTPAKHHAKQRALEAFRSYIKLLDPVMEVVRIPFEGREIVAYLRLPAQPRPAPLVFGIAGLDSRKEDIAAFSDRYLQHGVGLFAIDLPGTGEAPLATATPDGDRMFTAALDYLATRPDVDAARIVVQGRSWSGYWAAKLAHTERARLRGSVVHGGPVHGYFQPDWLPRSLASDEYLYDYFPATAALFGADSMEDLLARAKKFSLRDSGLLDQPSAPMLLVNGARDSQIPIADVFVLLEHGDAKEAWVNPAGGHMGRSPEWPANAIFEQVVMPWMLRRLQS